MLILDSILYFKIFVDIILYFKIFVDNRMNIYIMLL